MSRITRKVIVSAVGLVAAATWAFSGACDQRPLPGNVGANAPLPAEPTGGDPAARAPGIRFDWPASNETLADDTSGMIRYAVSTDRPMTARVVLDPDGVASNGNEIDLASGREFGSPGGSDEFEFVAGWYPYGTYFVRAMLTDGQNEYRASALGLVNVVPSGGGTDGSTGLEDVEGLRLLHFTGAPEEVEGRVPFVDTWHVLDVVDNLAPRFIAPITIEEAMEIHRFQFYVFGRTDTMEKRVEIWQGTDATSHGELLHRVEVETGSFIRGGWNSIVLNPPIMLQPGAYGISYHSKYEFTDHWAGNAPGGAGYVWVSAFGGAPFQKVGAAELGFNPSFAIRIMGRLVADTTAKAAAAHRIRIPDVTEPAAPTAGVEATPRGVIDRTMYTYEEEGESPFHVVWKGVE